MTPSSTPEPVDLSDPSLSPHQLHELAQTHPEHWDEILEHPNVYPGLVDWIRDRQAELAATGGGETVEESDAAAQEAVDETAAEQAAQAEDEADTGSSTATDDAEQEQPSWAMPDGSHSDHSPTAPAVEPEERASEAAAESEAFQPQAQPEKQPQQQPWGWSQPSGQQFGTPQPGFQQQQFTQQQYSQPQFNQPQQYAPQRKKSNIDLESSRTWGLFVAGGAAFLSLFGFIFAPTLDYTVSFASHLTAGGWIVLLLYIATVALSILQLLKPSPWMRFFFIVASLGAGFVMVGRALTMIGFFTMRYTGFSVLWLLFMSLVLLAGTFIYLAPKASDNQQPPQRQQPTGQQGQYQTPPQQYGQQPGQYPGHQSGPQHFGGYSQQ